MPLAASTAYVASAVADERHVAGFGSSVETTDDDSGAHARVSGKIPVDAAACAVERTFPLWLPTNTRPPTTVGCASAARSPGKPNAHLSFRRGTCAAVNPAAVPSCSRVLKVLTAQPFHAGPASGPAKSPESPEHIDCGNGLVTRGRPKDFPLTNSAMARRSRAVRPALIEIMTPLSSAARTRSGDIVRSASRLGARSKPVSWHVAQIRP